MYKDGMQEHNEICIQQPCKIMSAQTGMWTELKHQNQVFHSPMMRNGLKSSFPSR